MWFMGPKVTGALYLDFPKFCACSAVVMCDDEEGLPSRTEGPYKKGSSPGGSLNPDLQALTPSVPLESLNSSKNVFLHPLSFPGPQRKDISHFLYPSKDIPIACLFPTCSEVFGKTAIADDSDKGCAKDLGGLG